VALGSKTSYPMAAERQIQLVFLRKSFVGFLRRTSLLNAGHCWCFGWKKYQSVRI